MSKLIEHLKSFNRKERFILLNEALGTFQLSQEFRRRLEECLKLDFEIPACAYVAMDYHLDWIQVAMCHRDGELPLNEEQCMCRSDPIVEGTQEDIDLLIAFDSHKATHVILVEAKGDTSWSDDQLSSKVRRLARIFGSKSTPQDAIPHFVMMSHNEPKIQEVDNWPDWMKGGVWIELPLPKYLRWVTRSRGCKEEKGRSYGSYVVKKVRRQTATAKSVQIMCLPRG